MKEFMKNFMTLYKAYFKGGIVGGAEAFVLALLLGIPFCLVMTAIVVKSKK